MITVLSIQKKIRSLNGRMPGRLLYLTSYWIIYCTYYYNLEQIMDFKTVSDVTWLAQEEKKIEVCTST